MNASIIKMNNIFHTKGEKIVCAAAPGGYGHLIPILGICAHFSKHNKVYLVCFEKLNFKFSKKISLLYINENDKFEIDTYIKIFDEIKPSIVFDDWLIAFKIASMYKKIKCKISILRCEQFIGYKIINYHSFKRFKTTDVKEINKTLQYYKLNKVEDFRKLLIADITLIPSIPEMDPLPPNLKEIYGNIIVEYIGPLINPNFARKSKINCINSKLLKWIQIQKKASRTIICLTLGTVAWFNEELLVRILNDLNDSCLAVILSVSDFSLKRRIGFKAERNSNLKILCLPDLYHLLLYSDIAIHHCGHGTALLCILTKTKQITIPSGEFDRDDNAVRLERLGVSKRFASSYDTFDIKNLVFNIKDEASLGDNIDKYSKIINQYIYRGLNKADLLIDSFLKNIDVK